MENLHFKEGNGRQRNNLRRNRAKLLTEASFAAHTVIQIEMGKRIALGSQIAQKGDINHFAPHLLKDDRKHIMHQKEEHGNDKG